MGAPSTQHRIYQLQDTGTTFELATVSYVLKLCCVYTYRDALHHDEHHSKARLSLAELHLLKGELEACEHECVTLLRTDPGNEEATVVCM